MFHFEPVPVRRRVSAAVLAGLLHALVIAALIRAFAPSISSKIAHEALAVVTVTTVTTPPPPRSAGPPSASPSTNRAGAAGRKAIPRAIEAPVPAITLAPVSAPRAASTGTALIAGAVSTGGRTGAGSDGTGLGAAGSGTGGGARAVKIAGDINSARDYPPASRDARLGHFVVIALTISSDGRVRGCRVVTPSPDSDADRITCVLASERFRFSPARDSVGNPVDSVFGWKQRWFRPGEN